jgi:hypothetical protein
MMIARVALLLYLLPLLAAGQSSPETPTYYHEREFTTLDQLDAALESGEISYDDYLLLIEQFVGQPFGDLKIRERTELSASDTSGASVSSAGRPRVSYRGSFVQKLDEASPFVRYDRLTTDWKQLSFDIGLELRSRKQPLLRSRSITYRHARGQIVAGSYNLKVGNGLTLGESSYHAALHEDADLLSSVWMPIKNRHNGVLIRQQFGQFQAGGFASRVEGADFYRTVLGSFVERQIRKNVVGVLALNQRLGRRSGGRISQDFIAPYFSLKAKQVMLSGESSFETNGASAHVYQADLRQGNVSQQVTVFSYGREYTNLQSGGYAYSDYNQKQIEQLGFAFSDKRTGRQGLAATTEVMVVRRTSVELAIVRWNNNNDRRKCAAARATIDSDKIAGSKATASIRTIWENLDLVNKTDERWMASISAKVPFDEIAWEIGLKVGKRRHAGVLANPVGADLGLRWRLSSQVASTLDVNYYDPDAAKSNNDYFRVAVGQELTRFKEFSLRVKALCRYFLGRQRLDSWEARVTCDFLSRRN